MTREWEIIVPNLASHPIRGAGRAQFPYYNPGQAQSEISMNIKNEDKIKTLLNDVDKEFQGLNHYQRAKFAIEQISIWQQKFNEAKGKIPRESIVDVTSAGEIIGQHPEVES